MNYSLAIITYFTEDILNRGRFALFKESIDSLLKSNFLNTIFIVDDHSTVNTHLDYISSLQDNRLKIFKRDYNGGASKAYNTGIRLILESGCDYGFLANDDLVYMKDWFIPYLEVVTTTKIKHLSFFSETWTSDVEVSFSKNQINIENKLLNSYSYAQGGLLTFSKEMIDKIGYFKIMPYKFGHEHGNFSIRAIYHGFSVGFLDVVNSNNLLKYADDSGTITTRDSNFRSSADVNLPFLLSLTYEPCIE